MSYRFGVIAAYCSNFGHCVFQPPFGGLGTTYDVHLGLIGKRVVDFLLVLIELFCARCYGWGATSECRFKIGDFATMGTSWPRILGRKKGRLHQPFFFSENKTKWSFVWYKYLDRSFFRFVTIHAFDRHTDRRTDI